MVPPVDFSGWSSSSSPVCQQAKKGLAGSEASRFSAAAAQRRIYFALLLCPARPFLGRSGSATEPFADISSSSPPPPSSPVTREVHVGEEGLLMRPKFLAPSPEDSGPSPAGVTAGLGRSLSPGGGGGGGVLQFLANSVEEPVQPAVRERRPSSSAALLPRLPGRFIIAQAGSGGAEQPRQRHVGTAPGALPRLSACRATTPAQPRRRHGGRAARSPCLAPFRRRPPCHACLMGQLPSRDACLPTPQTACLLSPVRLLVSLTRNPAPCACILVSYPPSTDRLPRGPTQRGHRREPEKPTRLDTSDYIWEESRSTPAGKKAKPGACWIQTDPHDFDMQP